MKKNKRILVVVAVVVVVGVAMSFMFLRNRGSDGMGMSRSGQITIVNDSADTISISFTQDGKEVDQKIAPRTKLSSGNNGFVRVFTAEKNGSYELEYPAAGATREITLSQITSSVKKEKVDNQVFSKKGMIGDVKVTYEELIQSDETY